MAYRKLALAVLFGSASGGTAWAGDKPILAPAPAWVKPAPPIDVSKLDGNAPVVLRLDTQQKLEDGQVWSYVDSATRAASEQVMSAIGTIQLPWNPDHGDLIVHVAEVIRGTEHIDLLKGKMPFSVLRREQQLDKRVLDGVLTATMPVEGLRVGDVLHMSFSITLKDSVLKGNVQSAAPVLFDPFRIQYARLRVLWPEKSIIHWRSYGPTPIPAPVVINGYNELNVPQPQPKLPDMPKDAPARYQVLPLLEASSFTDWSAVAEVMAPLYDTTGVIDPAGPIAAEVAKIKAADSDPVKRAAMALQLVQDRIRYQLLGMSTGNYQPQTPAQTWSVRFGDCKAKTLLLLAILRELGIEAEPVLASSQLGDMLPNRLPSAAAFDHIFVKAVIAGETFWLDGTGAGARLADIRDTPPLGWVLPVHAGGSALIAIPKRADARPDVAAEIDYDETAGIDLPASFTAAVTFRGGTAQQMKLGAAQGSRDDIDKFSDQLIVRYVPDATIATRALSFDDAAGTATITASGVAYPGWGNEDGRRVASLDSTIGSIDFSPDRAREAWRDIPVSIGAPATYRSVTRTHLPNRGAGFALEGETAVDAMLAGRHVVRTAGLSGDTIAVTAQTATDGREIAAADIPAERKRLAAADAVALRALAPADYPGRWIDVAVAKKAHRFDPVIAAYTKRITDKPDEADRYTDRAWFYGRIFDRRAAIADRTKAIAIAATADIYQQRSSDYQAVGDDKAALADAIKAHDLDPASGPALAQLTWLMARTGDLPGAIALVQERIDSDGGKKSGFLSNLADLQVYGGDGAAAIATMDRAVADNPGKPDLLNSRCWIKAQLNTALDTALKDCTKAIELSESPAGALDSRALVYFRLNRLDDALSDLDAALRINPELSASLYLRSIVRKRMGNDAAAAADMLGARTLSPRIDEVYKHFGVVP